MEERTLTTLSFGSVVIESNLRGVEQAQEEFSLKLGADDGVWGMSGTRSNGPDSVWTLPKPRLP